MALSQAKPQPGDLIEIFRLGYQHWALYVGNGYVVHLAPPRENSGVGASTGLGVVKRELLKEVVENCSYEVNNHLDHLYKPRSTKQMLTVAEEMVGKKIEYSVLSGNCDHFVTDLRYGKAISRQLREEPKPGDLIEISRIGSSHWALYVGDGYVIHLAPPGEMSEGGAPTGLGVVKRELLKEVVENCSYEVNNHLDHLYKPRPIMEMLTAAEEMVGMEMEYSVLSRSSEHFVTDLRYGKASGRQFREEPKPGDLIEISRIGSSHWALYEGDGYVIHLAPPGEKSGAGTPTSLEVVKRQLLEAVVENSSYKVNNHLDHLYKPRPIKKILKSGKEMVGKEMEDNDLRRNSEHFVFDLRYGKARSRQFREEPKPGDLIEISRIGSSHWVLYEGDGYVIHLAPPEENSEAGSPTGLGVVKRELLVDVAENCSYKVNNYLDHVYTPWPMKKIIELGNWLVGRKTEYPVLSRNCEHFVTDLRYSNFPSQQREEEPRPGDMIEISHQFYCTWALYVGEGDVIHLAPPGQSRSTGFSKLPMFLRGRAEVKKEPLQMAASGSPYKVNNHLDHKYRPRPVDEIITSAKKMIGDQKTYIVLLKNSERFVADLRYGLSRRELSSDDPMPGDLLEISQGVHKHWAIYVGAGYVIHAATKGVSCGPSCSSNVRDYVVKWEPLRAVAEGNKVKVNNYLDNKVRPRPGHDIVSLARKKVGETWNDNLCFPTVSTLSQN
ncbi:uncharacterized protein LOC118707299 isoform X2 [Pipistrellus kuhlii]|uniref:uncharacterized protein LOC118707299 isoform X2 n=1 Tax=Pipistrellus kuhlii TaxID=59472 RepID=UPI001E27470E|nr:uncharacterized protein LOC118707299 isoform X2 [Pipistrellus kuhlii]